MKNYYLFINEKLNDGRVARILHNWDNDIYLDPPIVEICNHDFNKISFSDGRHRTKTAYLLDADLVPIAVHKSDFKKVINILK